MKLALLGLMWAVWGGLHSLLVSPAWMRTVSARFPGLCPWYRLASSSRFRYRSFRNPPHGKRQV